MIPRTLDQIVVDVLRRTEELERKVENRRRKGPITDVDIAKGLARMQIDTDDQGKPVKSPWVQWAETRMGKVKTHFTPSVGEIVELVCENGDFTDAYIGFSFPSDANPRPSQTDGEAMVKVGDKTTVSYTEDRTAHVTPHSKVDSGKIEFQKQGGTVRRGHKLGGGMPI